MIYTLDEVSIVIPAFNEGPAIEHLLDQLSQEQRLGGAEIIVVDDASSDDTARKIANFGRVHLIKHRVNQGYGGALVSGMSVAHREYVVWMDADGQHRLEDLLAVCDAMVRDDLDYCIGVRSASSYSDPGRKFGKLVLRRVVQLAAAQTVRDFNSGLRGFRRSLIRKYLHLFPRGFGASTMTTLLMMERNYIGAEVPILVSPRIGKSSVKQVRDGLRTLTLILRIFLLFKPLHFFGAVGLAMSLSGLGYSLWSALTEGLGFPVLGAVVLLSGIQMMFLGLIMDQISAMRRERFE